MSGVKESENDVADRLEHRSGIFGGNVRASDAPVAEQHRGIDADTTSLTSKQITQEDREAWLRENGWVQAPNGTWGLPRSTCRSVSGETAFHIGTILEAIDNE